MVHAKIAKFFNLGGGGGGVGPPFPSLPSAAAEK